MSTTDLQLPLATRRSVSTPAVTLPVATGRSVSTTDVQQPFATVRSLSTPAVKLPLVTGSMMTFFFLLFPQVTGVCTVVSDPLARSVACCASVRHLTLLDNNCFNGSAAASRTRKGKHLIARCSTTASDDPSVAFNRTLDRNNVMISTTSVCAPVKIRSFRKPHCFMTT